MCAGVSDKVDHLEFSFPRKRKSFYLGAAHGTIGIMYMLLKALQIIPGLQKDQDFVGIVRNTV